MLKKIGIISLALMMMACASNNKNQEFVNPIFYEVMNPFSTGTWHTQITPNMMISSNKGDVVKQVCALIENKMETVTLKCMTPYPELIIESRKNPKIDDYFTIYRFVLRPDKEFFGDLFVDMYYNGVGAREEFTSHASLYIIR